MKLKQLYGQIALYTLVVLTFVFGLGWPILSAAAQTDFNVEIQNQPAPVVAFGQAIEFRLTATSTVPVVDATLAIRMADARRRTYWGKAQLGVPSTQLEITYQLDMQQWSAEAFSMLEYWWVFTDANNRTISTPPQTLQYTDNRFEWRSLTDGRVAVYWQAGDEAFGQMALQAAADGLARASQLISTTPPEQVAVYIYPDLESLQGTFVPTDPTWMDGKAFPKWDTVVVAVPDDVNALTALNTEIPHEVAHLIIFRAAGSEAGYNNLPQWLNEGLAVFNEGNLGAEEASLLSAAKEAQELPSLERLCFNFSAVQSEAFISYAQSASVVRHIQRIHGIKRLNALVQAYADGVDCDNGVRRALGLGLQDLEQEWLKATFSPAGNRVTFYDATTWGWLAGLVGVSSLLFTLSILFGQRRKPASRMI
jgi:hypothetical protein